MFVNYGDKENLLDHIDDLIKIGGTHVVGLGPDFADYLPQYMSEIERKKYPIEAIMPTEGFASDEDIPILLEDLKHKGYQQSVIEGIMGGNLLRVFKEVFK